MGEAPAPVRRRLDNKWNDRDASDSSPLGLLRYRSNLLGADTRITNFGGGNTSAKFVQADPLTGAAVRILAVKGSGGDLGSIDDSGFAQLRLDALEALAGRYRGEAHEDEMVALYPLCAFAGNRVPASIDTPLHAFLPFAHVDHLHPDWAIALAASVNGRRRLDEFNQRYGRHLIWMAWQRPGFELAMQIRRAIEAEPSCDGILLASHGLFTWGDTSRSCYEASIATIDQLGTFVESHANRNARHAFGGRRIDPPPDRESLAAAILPRVRGQLSAARRVVAHWDHSDDAVAFASSRWAPDLCAQGTSCPDHFLRTRICPMYVPMEADDDPDRVSARIAECLARYRRDYTAYYDSFAQPDSPPLRDANPSLIVLPGLGLFGFARNKREAGITTEFFVNAVHVMAGATALEDAESSAPGAFHNYMALPRSEAFRIEYWALEEAKLRRQPPECELSRTVALVVGGGSGIGRDAVLQLAARGAHVVVADRQRASAEAVWSEARDAAGADAGLAIEIDLASRASIAAAVRQVILRFGGLDVIVNTAAIYPSAQSDGASEAVWAETLHVNVTSNHVLVEEAFKVLAAQNLPASIVLTTSANAVVPKRGSEAYDVSKAALSHLIRELAVGLGPLVRVNGVAPATVVSGSSMFPRDRVVASLRKYGIAFDDGDSTESLRTALASFYAERTILRQPILPRDCANAICWLAGSASAKTTGHIIPVDGGLSDAFFR